MRFVGVAGASAGAVVAALVGAGYTADELYCPSPRGGVLAKDYLELFGRDTWKRFRLFQKRATAAIADDRGLFGYLKSAIGFVLFNWGTIKHIRSHRGFVSTDPFSTWFEELLQRKLRKEGGGRATFKDMPRLKIIVTDATNGRAKLFCVRRTPDASVTDAVAASISIPFVFIPKVVNGCRPRRWRTFFEFPSVGI